MHHGEKFNSLTHYAGGLLAGLGVLLEFTVARKTRHPCPGL